MDMLADEFNKQLKGGDDVRKYARAVGKLRKEAERVKDVLSANQAYQVCTLCYLFELSHLYSHM